MKSIIPLISLVAAQSYVPPQTPVIPAAPAMDPMMMMLLMKDGSSSMSDLLPLMMMGGMGGQGGMGGMTAGGQPGGMNPLLMMTLLDDDCSFKTELNELKDTADDVISKDLMKKLATGASIFIDANGDGKLDAGEEQTTAQTGLTQAQLDTAVKYIDYDYQACNNKGGMSDMLPLMMMGGGNMGGMDPMMMMMMMDGGGMDDLLPLMMMGGQQPGQQGGMNPLLMMTLLDGDSDKTRMQCDADYNVDKAFKITTNLADFDLATTTTNSEIRDAFKTPHASAVLSTKGTSYKDCLNAATKEGEEKSTMDKLLPLMLMGGQGMGGMDPMMMMLLLKN